MQYTTAIEYCSRVFGKRRWCIGERWMAPDHDRLLCYALLLSVRESEHSAL